MFEDLNSFLEIDEGDIEAEDVAGESCDPSKPIAGVCYGEDPMEDKCPSKMISKDFMSNEEQGYGVGV